MENTELIKAIKSFIGDRVYYDEYGGGYIWGVTGNREEVQMIAQVEDVEDGNAVVSVRGWGAIKNLKNLPCSPEKFQDFLGEFIAEAINEKMNANTLLISKAPEMLDMLKSINEIYPELELRQLIKEATEI